MNRWSTACPWIALVLLLTCYAIGQWRVMTPAYGEPDPDGYFILARRMADGQPLARPASDPFRYQTHVWVENAHGQVIPKFAPGYPALLAIAYRIGGPGAMFWVSPVMGGIALVGAFLLFRLWMHPLVSLAAIAAMVGNSTLAFYSSFALTHAADLAVTVWAIYLLFRWMNRPSVLRGAGAGLVIGSAMLIRHSSALLLLPAAGAIIFALIPARHERETPPWRGSLALALACSVGPALLMAYNLRYFGHALHSGYYLSQEQAAFSLANFVNNAGMLARGLAQPAGLLIAPLGLVGMAARGPWRDRALRVLWFLPPFVLYASYYWSFPNNAYYRFMICITPVLVGSAFLLIDQLSSRPWPRVAGVLLVLCAGVLFDWPGLVHIWDGSATERSRPIAQMAALMDEHLPPDAVVFTRSPFRWAIEPRANYTLYALESFERSFVEELRQGGRNPRIQPVRLERMMRLYQRMSDDQLQQMQRALIDRMTKQGRPVALIVSQRELEQQRKLLGDRYRLEPAAEIDLGRGRWVIRRVHRID